MKFIFNLPGGYISGRDQSDAASGMGQHPDLPRTGSRSVPGCNLRVMRTGETSRIAAGGFGAPFEPGQHGPFGRESVARLMGREMLGERQVQRRRKGRNILAAVLW